MVVDLPPQVGSGIASALLIADLFAIPVTPSGVDLRATGKALDLLRRARAVRGSPSPPACWCRAGWTGAPRSAGAST